MVYCTLADCFPVRVELDNDIDPTLYQVLVVKDPQALLIQVERLGDPLVPLPEVKGDGRDVLETSAGEEWVEAVFDQFKKLVLGGQKKVRPAPAVSPEVVQLD